MASGSQCFDVPSRPRQALDRPVVELGPIDMRGINCEILGASINDGEVCDRSATTIDFRESGDARRSSDRPHNKVQFCTDALQRRGISLQCHIYYLTAGARYLPQALGV